jgi:SulP family sulfate permease
MFDAHADDPNEDCPLQDLLPGFTELSLHPDGSLRDAHRHGLALCQRIAAVRFDGPLNFATIGYFAEKLRLVLERRPSVTHILIAGHTLAGVDSIAADEFHDLSARLRREGYFVAISGLKDEELEALSSAGQDDTIGVDAIFPTQAVAIESMHADAHRASEEGVCPLVEVVPAE